MQTPLRCGQGARQLPLFTTRLDLLVVAAPRDENLGGLPDVLARYAVSRAVVTSVPQMLLSGDNIRILFC